MISAVTSLPPPGWYQDPHNPQQLRLWDGQRWAAPGLQPPSAAQPQASAIAQPQAPVMAQPQAPVMPQAAAQTTPLAVPPSPPRSPGEARRYLFPALVAIALVAVAGGGVAIVASLDDGIGSASAGNSAPSSTSSAAAMNGNASICIAVQQLVSSEITPTFGNWNRTTNEFDPKVAHDLRDEATQLASVGGNASGAPGTAIRNESKALTNLSNAINARSHSRVSSASTTANNALTQLRAACRF